MNLKQSNKIEYLESLRGFACLCVFINHFCAIFLPSLLFDDRRQSLISRLFQGTPLYAITNGNTPVQFFFVLSGYLIVKSVYTKKEKAIRAENLWKRFWRLFAITTPAIIFTFVLLKCGLMYHQQALALKDTLSYVANFYTFEPTLGSLVKDLLKVCIDRSIYVGPLWTISLELAGSCLITFVSFGLSKLSDTWEKSKERLLLNKLLIYALLLLMISHSEHNFAGFIVGGCVWELSQSYIINKWLSKTVSFRVLCMLIGIFLAGMNGDGFGMYGILNVVSNYRVIVRAFGIGMVFLVLLSSKKFQDTIVFQPLVCLGGISDYVYAFHYPLLFSLGCFLYMKFYGLGNYAIELIIFIVCFATTCLFAKTYKIVKMKIKGILGMILHLV